MNTLAVKSHEALASDIRFDSYMMHIIKGVRFIYSFTPDCV